jgi:guanylate kinase
MSINYEHFSSLGIALIVSGPSGAGKTTVCDKLLRQNKRLQFSISCTTREPRKGELHGKDYYFISADEFKRRVENDEFLEYAEVHDNYYGTLKTEVTTRVREGKDVLIDIDVQGMRQMRKATAQDPFLDKCSTYVFIAPPSYSELEMRLIKRGTEGEQIVSKRLLNARKELKAWNEYDFLIINDEIDKAVSRLQSVIAAASIRTDRLFPTDAWPYV